MTLPTIPYGFTPRDYQEGLFKAMDSGLTRAILVWPRQVGKDTSCFAYMAKKAAEVPGNYFYIFPEAKQAKMAIWGKIINEKTGQRLVDMLPGDDLIPGIGLVKGVNNQEMVITLTNNSTINVIGLDKDPNKARGISPTGIIFSEFAFSDPESFANVTPALRREGSWCIVNSTPNGRNHFYEMLESCRNDPDWYVSELQGRWPQRDDYIFIHTDEEYEKIAELPGYDWDRVDREYGCSFTTSMSGSIYNDLLTVAWNTGRVTEVLYDETRPVHTFWDIGVDDDTVVWFMQKIGNSYNFIDYFEENGKGFDFYVDKLKELGYTYGTHYLPHDTHQRKPGRVISTPAEQFHEALVDKECSGSYEILSKLPIQDGIDAARSKFSLCRFNARTCAKGLKHLELYHRKYDKIRRVFSKVPEHDDHSHAADAFRYFGIHEDKRNDFFYNINKLTIDTEYNPFD